jgi:hypothetical protein
MLPLVKCHFNTLLQRGITGHDKSVNFFIHGGTEMRWKAVFYASGGTGAVCGQYIWAGSVSGWDRGKGCMGFVFAAARSARPLRSLAFAAQTAVIMPYDGIPIDQTDENVTI